jgi:hypothetical protein
MPRSVPIPHPAWTRSRAPDGIAGAVFGGVRGPGKKLVCVQAGCGIGALDRPKLSG